MTRGTLLGNPAGIVIVVPDCNPTITDSGITLDTFNRSIGPLVVGTGTDHYLLPGCASAGYPWFLHGVNASDAYEWVDGEFHAADTILTGPRGYGTRDIIFVPLDPRHLTLRVPVTLLPIAPIVPTDFGLGHVQPSSDAGLFLNILRQQGTPQDAPATVHDLLSITIDNVYSTWYGQTVIGNYDLIADDSYLRLAISSPDGLGGYNSAIYQWGADGGSRGGGNRQTVVEDVLTVTVDDATFTVTFHGQALSVPWTPTALDASVTYLRLEVEPNGGVGCGGGACVPADGLPDGRTATQLGDITVYSDLGNCVVVPAC